jgi:hypothetical protein
VREEVRNGVVSLAAARRDYGVDPVALTVLDEETARLRRAAR